MCLAVVATKSCSPPSARTRFKVATTLAADSSLLRVAVDVWSDRDTQVLSTISYVQICADKPCTPRASNRWVNRIIPGWNVPCHCRSRSEERRVGKEVRDEWTVTG